MNRKQLKEATDAFVNELVEVRTMKAKKGIIPLPESYDIFIGGRWARINGNDKERIEFIATGLRASIAKVYRKHIKQLLEAQ